MNRSKQTTSQSSIRTISLNKIKDQKIESKTDKRTTIHQPTSRSTSKENVNFKRKFSSISGEIADKSKLSIIKTKIDDIYKKYTSGNNNIKTNITDWKKCFKDLFEKEKIIDFSAEDYIPKSLDARGSYCLSLEKVWVMWIETCKKDISLAKLINLVSNALDFLNEPKTIINLFNNLIIELKITKATIKKYCEEKGINYQYKIFKKNF
jgi:hypothetical protein